MANPYPSQRVYDRLGGRLGTVLAVDGNMVRLLHDAADRPVWRDCYYVDTHDMLGATWGPDRPETVSATPGAAGE